LAVQRTWKNGDRVELEIGMPLRLEAVDGQTPNTVALIRGPVALFALSEMPARVTRSQLLAAAPASRSPEDWVVTIDKTRMLLRPFAAIRDGSYRLYHRVET
jgi:uncharacterized protein